MGGGICEEQYQLQTKNAGMVQGRAAMHHGASDLPAWVTKLQSELSTSPILAVEVAMTVCERDRC